MATIKIHCYSDFIGHQGVSGENGTVGVAGSGLNNVQSLLPLPSGEGRGEGLNESQNPGVMIKQMINKLIKGGEKQIDISSLVSRLKRKKTKKK